jgi:glutathione S-transferase
MNLVFFGTLVAKARQTYGIKAPAVSGNEQFERIYRVHINTLELLVVFFPSAYAAAHYWPSWIVAIAMCVYIAGRFVYWRSYTANPSSRTLGFTLSIAPVMALALCALVPALLGKSAA